MTPAEAAMRTGRHAFRRPALVLATVTAMMTAASAANAQAEEAPPLAPQKPGPLVEGTFGVFVPTGALAKVSAPGPWGRIAAGYDITRWLTVYALIDSAFLSTGRASPPPSPRGYNLWGFGGGARVGFPIGARFRIPLRLEVGAHEADDDGVLGTYGFTGERSFKLSLGAATGVEWRAPTRHYGVFFEVGVRRDSEIVSTASGGSAGIAITSALGLRVTL